MLRKGMVNSEEDLRTSTAKWWKSAAVMGKPVAATCDAHYLNEEDYIYRNIIMAAHGFKELDENPASI